MEQGKEKKKWLKTFAITFTSVLLIMGVIVGITIGIENNNERKKQEQLAIEKSKEVVVPNLIGKTIAEAKTELAELELNVKALYPTLNSDSPEAIIQKQNKKEGEIAKKGDTIEVEANTQEQLDEKEKKRKEAAEAEKVKPENVKVGKTIPLEKFTSENKATRWVCSVVLSSYEKVYPNIKVKEFEIREADGHGRFWVYMEFMTTPNSEKYSYANEIVWLKDEDNCGMYLTTGGIYAAKSQVKWGTTLDK